MLMMMMMMMMMIWPRSKLTIKTRVPKWLLSRVPKRPLPHSVARCCQSVFFNFDHAFSLVPCSPWSWLSSLPYQPSKAALLCRSLEYLVLYSFFQHEETNATNPGPTWAKYNLFFPVCVLCLHPPFKSSIVLPQATALACFRFLQGTYVLQGPRFHPSHWVQELTGPLQWRRETTLWRSQGLKLLVAKNMLELLH